MQGVEVVVETKVHPTESPAKVERCVRELIDLASAETSFHEDTSILVAKGGLEILEPLRRKIIQRGVEAAFREALRRSVERGTNFVKIDLHKQAACVGKPSLAMDDIESPLGPISVIIRAPSTEELYRIIEWLTGG